MPPDNDLADADEDGSPWSTWDESAPAPTDNLKPEGIVPLGYDRGICYYLSTSMRQVYALTAQGHTKNSLTLMASVPHYWQRTRFVNKKGNIDWDEAIDDLMRKCRDVGIYDPERVRGRGAWLDDGRPVLHLGDHLLVAGSRCDLALPGSRNVYEAARPLIRRISDPLSTTEANQLVQICRSLKWERGLSGTLLAGFIALAPVCGGLAWRPSIWITGSRGSGKSWLAENILAPAIGAIALQVQSVTTEPALRRALGSDARPVLFDEAEQEGQAATTRMQAVLGLVRQSSSESSAEILKANQGSGVDKFRIRSCFAFLSINVGIEQSADESRITVLALKSIDADTPNGRKSEDERFQWLSRLVTDTITPGFSAGLLARSVKLLPTIRANAETFARAVAIHVGSRRLGDQVGTLLAGAFSLHSERAISMADAEAFVRREDWTGETEAPERSDEARLLDAITQARIGIAHGSGARIEASVGRLLLAAAGRDAIEVPLADYELRQIGIRVTHPETGGGADGFHISNTHPAIRRLLSGTPWVSQWHRSLARLSGSETSDNSVRFGPGHKSRAVWVPWHLFEDIET